MSAREASLQTQASVGGLLQGLFEGANAIKSLAAAASTVAAESAQKVPRRAPAADRAQMDALVKKSSASADEFVGHTVAQRDSQAEALLALNAGVEEASTRTVRPLFDWSLSPKISSIDAHTTALAALARDNSARVEAAVDAAFASLKASVIEAALRECSAT